MKLVAAAVAALTATATLTSACVPFGCGADTGREGVDGEWRITELVQYQSPCPTPVARELTIYVEGGEVTVVTDDVELIAHRVWVDGERHFVELTTRGSWLYNDAEGGILTEDQTYQLELVPMTGRLEGSVSTSFDYPRIDAPAIDCAASGAASGELLAPPA